MNTFGALCFLFSLIVVAFAYSWIARHTDAFLRTIRSRLDIKLTDMHKAVSSQVDFETFYRRICFIANALHVNPEKLRFEDEVFVWACTPPLRTPEQFFGTLDDIVEKECNTVGLDVSTVDLRTLRDFILISNCVHAKTSSESFTLSSDTDEATRPPSRPR